MKINENLDFSMKIMVPYARGTKKIMKIFIGQEKKWKSHFYFPSKNIIPGPNTKFRVSQRAEKHVTWRSKTWFFDIYYRKSLLPE